MARPQNPSGEGWNPTPSSPGRKDTKRWCRGKVGREHAPVVVRDKWTRTTECRTAPDWWWKTPAGSRQIRTGHQRNWWCRHHEECATCGKVLRHSIPPEDCPDRG